ncbi:MAG: ABC transporter ATP-binding protein [Helcococcus sp.]|nr:ABC transporter ATP-binding protein [Helcococcus sp.]
MKLILKNIEKKFDKTEVLKGASYEFENGKIYGLLGRNGAGKTTLFNIIYTELQQDNGDIILEINGEEISPSVDDIGMIFAETYLPDFLTGYEYAKFITDISAPHERANLDYLFDEMNIDEKDRHKLIKEYSSGMKSKVALLAIYIQKPKIILLDEPLTAVDVISGQEIKSFFKSLRRDHIVIVSTHMLELAKDLCDDIVLLNKGHLQSIERLEKDENYENIIIEALGDSDD